MFSPLTEAEKLRRIEALDEWLAERRRARIEQEHNDRVQRNDAAPRTRTNYLRHEQDERAELYGGA